VELRREGRPPDYSDEEIRQILFRLIGEVVPLKVTRVSYWTVNNIVARRYSKGRVFCMGDAVHRHPPTNGLGSNTSIQDAYNLAWKLALVLKGKAGPSLLDSYNDERQPVGKQIVTRANKSIEDTLPIFETLGITGAATDEELKRRLDKRKLSTVEAEAQRKALNKQIRNKSYEFNCHGVEMGQRYASQAVVPDGTPEPEYTRDRELYYHPTTWPGARLPHVWVEHGGEKVSTLDLVGRGRFTLLTGVSGSSWVEAAARTSAETGVEVRALQIGPGCEVIDTFGDWAMQSEVSDSGCVLVRPDGYVGWRAHMLSSEPTAELTRVMKSILGTGVMAERSFSDYVAAANATLTDAARNRQIGTGEARFDLYHSGPSISSQQVRMALAEKGAHGSATTWSSTRRGWRTTIPTSCASGCRAARGANWSRATPGAPRRAPKGSTRPPFPRSSTGPSKGCTWTPWRSASISTAGARAGRSLSPRACAATSTGRSPSPMACHCRR
jgi:hypothetical protein